jgi:hypothetical protein
MDGGGGLGGYAQWPVARGQAAACLFGYKKIKIYSF